MDKLPQISTVANFCEGWRITSVQFIDTRLPVMVFCLGIHGVGTVYSPTSTNMELSSRTSCYRLFFRTTSTGSLSQSAVVKRNLKSTFRRCLLTQTACLCCLQSSTLNFDLAVVPKILVSSEMASLQPFRNVLTRCDFSERKQIESILLLVAVRGWSASAWNWKGLPWLLERLNLLSPHVRLNLVTCRHANLSDVQFAVGVSRMLFRRAEVRI